MSTAADKLFDETRDALRLAHEALRWLARVRTYTDTITMATGVQLAELVELFAIAVCCAELHAARDPITMGDVLKLAGWDGSSARAAVECAMQRLDDLGMIKGCRLVVS